jgi:predicted PurR-regulated permease PerM
LAVVALPVHTWISGKIQNPDRAAAIACVVIGATLLLPALLVGTQAASQAASGFESLQDDVAAQGGWERAAASADPRVARLIAWARSNINWERELDRLRQTGQRYLTQWAGGTIWAAINTLLTLFLLFYFFRDHRQVVGTLRQLMPLSGGEASFVLTRVRDMIHSTIYGTLAVAAIQGILGGLMFLLLGVPGALFWGLVMAILSIIPVLGAFTVWLPAALFLAVQGEWWKSVVLVVWGVAVVGTIDNLLYPILVGKETRLHTVPVFVAIVGGLTLFGAAGLVIGPVILSFTWALLEVLRKRAQTHDGVVEEPVLPRRKLAPTA